MKLRIMSTCKCGCGEPTYLDFRSKYLSIHWFNDYGEWFLYFYIRKKYYRFSSCGFMKGDRKWN